MGTAKTQDISRARNEVEGLGGDAEAGGGYAVAAVTEQRPPAVVQLQSGLWAPPGWLCSACAALRQGCGTTGPGHFSSSHRGPEGQSSGEGDRKHHWSPKQEIFPRQAAASCFFFFFGSLEGGNNERGGE